MPFVKLDCDIVKSSVWAEDSDVLRVWVYLLATANAIGEVHVTVPALAMQCGLPAEKTQAILDKLASPDRFSRSQEYEGRRVQIERDPEFRIVVLNYVRYREKDYTNAERQRRFRDKQKRRRPTVTPLRNAKVTPRNTSQKSEVRSQKSKSTETKTLGADAPGVRFEDFYHCYPKHEARQDAGKAWAKLSQEERIECLERTPAWVKARAGTERRFLPKPATFLNGKRWRDELQNPNEKVGSPGGEVDTWCAACGAQQRQAGSKYCRHCSDAMAAHVCPKCEGPNPHGFTECQTCFERANPDAAPAHVAEIFGPLAVPS